MAEALFADTRFKLVLDATVPTASSPPVGTTPALDTEGNRSYVRAALRVVKIGASTAFSSDPSYWALWAGTAADDDAYAFPNGSVTYNFGAYNELVIWSGGFWVPHAEDGTGTVRLAASAWFAGLLGNAIIDPYDQPLTTIDRNLVRVGVDDEWVDALAYVGVNNQWRPAMPYVGVDDAWTRLDNT